MKKINSLFLITIFFGNSCTFAQATSYSNVAKKHLPIFSFEQPVCAQEPVQQNILKRIALELNPKIEKSLPLAEYEYYRIVYNLFETIQTTDTDTINGNCLHDLNILHTESESKKTLVSLFDKTNTKFGHVYLSNLLASPTTDIKKLQSRQAITHFLLKNKTVHNQIKMHLEAIKKAEDEFLFLWKTESKNIDSINPVGTSYYNYSLPGLNKLNALNKSSIIQQVTTLTGVFDYPAQLVIGTTLTAFTTNYVAQNANYYFTKYSPTVLSDATNSGAKYATEWMENVKKSCTPDNAFVAKTLLTAWTTYKILGQALITSKRISFLRTMQAKMIPLASVIRSMKSLEDIVSQHPELSQNLEYFHDLDASFGKNATASDSLKALINLFETNTFSDQNSFVLLYGRITAAYAILLDIKDEFTPALHALGEIDTYAGIATLVDIYQNTNTPFTPALYSTDTAAPFIDINTMWNPFVSQNNAVTNSIILGGSERHNGIITGPNAGGKSTFLKGLTISIIAGQTIGFVPATTMKFTPFSKISTYMNITDDILAGNSLFQSELIRAKKLMDTVKEAHAHNKFSFAVLDEVFCGTSPKEGEAASYSLAHKLGAITTNISLIATHFPLMTTLEENTHNYNNYQVRVEYQEDGSFIYPYKLQRGIADQNVAFDMLNAEGFDIENFEIAAG